MRGKRPPRRWLPRIISATGAGAVFLGLALAYQLGHLRLTVRSQESYIASVSTHVPTLIRVGLSDHIHCSVFRKYPKNPPTTKEFVEAMNPKYAGLIPIVRSQVPETYRMTLAHECRFHGRTFVHLSLRDDANTLSLVIARKAEGESFAIEDTLPAFVRSGIPMYQAGVQRFHTTAFETGDYLVYFISDLGKQQNADVMLALAPLVNNFLGKLAL